MDANDRAAIRHKLIEQRLALPNRLALAADLHWTGGAGDNRYTTPGNWDAGRAPTEGDNVYIYAPETTIITCDSDTSAANYLISTASLNFGSFANRLLVRGDADIFGDWSRV